MIAVSMVKDEIDVIDLSIQNMLLSVDKLFVADNMSSDGTYERLLEYEADNRDRMMVVRDSEVGYYQSSKMSRWATQAVSLWGPDIIVPFDADEVWENVHFLKDEAYSNVDVFVVPGVDHRPTAEDGDKFMPYREVSQKSFEPKVAFRWREGATIQQGNHGVVFPVGPSLISSVPNVLIHHYPVRSLAQFIKKARNGGAAYDATDLHPTMGNHWRRWGRMSDGELEEEFYSQFYRKDLNGLTCK